MVEKHCINKTLLFLILLVLSWARMDIRKHYVLISDHVSQKTAAQNVVELE
jgi:hypothetical protein